MKPHTFTYILSFLLFCCASFMGYTEAHAQRARKHRERILSADSIRAMDRKDSLQAISLKDTLTFARDSAEWLENEKIASLEAPIDTAELARKNDSIQSTVLQCRSKRRNGGSPTLTRRYGSAWLYPEPDKYTTENTGSCLLSTEDLSVVPMR